MIGKIIGSVSVIGCFFVWGMLLSARLSERCRLLRRLESDAAAIKSELEFCAPPIGKCFSGRCELLSQAARKMEAGEDAANALRTAAEENPFLNARDREALSAFADGLLAQDVFGQIANVALFAQRVSSLARQAEEDAREKGRLYRGGGALCGVAVVILLL